MNGYVCTDDGRIIIAYDPEKSFRKGINSIRADFLNLIRDNKALRETVHTLEKNAGIDDKNREIQSIQQRAIAILSSKGHERDKAFRSQHYQQCNNGNHFIYDIQETGFGVIVKIKCPVCGAEEDLTDTESW